MPPKTVYQIDGANFDTLEGFYEEISQVLIPQVSWGHNLDAFDDILCGGFGTPEEGFALVWKNSALSKVRLGYEETVRQLEKMLERCHHSNRERVGVELALAKSEKGETVFDWLIDILQKHGTGGLREEDGVELYLQ